MDDFPFDLSELKKHQPGPEELARNEAERLRREASRAAFLAERAVIEQKRNQQRQDQQKKATAILQAFGGKPLAPERELRLPVPARGARALLFDSDLHVCAEGKCYLETRPLLDIPLAAKLVGQNCVDPWPRLRYILGPRCHLWEVGVSDRIRLPLLWDGKWRVLKCLSNQEGMEGAWAPQLDLARPGYVQKTTVDCAPQLDRVVDLELYYALDLTAGTYRMHTQPLPIAGNIPAPLQVTSQDRQPLSPVPVPLGDSRGQILTTAGRGRDDLLLALAVDETVLVVRLWRLPPGIGSLKPNFPR